MDKTDLRHLKLQRRVPTRQDLHGALRYLAAHGISAWVHGGWAVEALVGKNLSHQDIDLFVPADQRAQLQTLLGEQIVLRCEKFLVWNYDSVQIDIILLSPYKTREAIAFHRDIFWVFPHPRFSSTAAPLDGASIPIVTPAFILAEQEHSVRKKKKSIPKMLERAAMLREVLPPSEIEASRKMWPHVNSPLNRLLLRLGLI